MNDQSPLPIDEGRRLLDSGDPEAAIRVLEPLTRHPDPEVAGEALVLTGTARYRIDDEAGALTAWRAAGNAGGSSAWLGWRSAAEQAVRDGNLEEAIAAYREADRRAPAAERGAIANRIAWLLKETGHDFESRRQFNRARGAYATYTGYVTIGIIGICIGLFAVDVFLSNGATLGGGMFGGSVGPLGAQNLINASAVAQGEWWRIFTSAFFHLGAIHLAFNMYVLYLYGQIAERMYGRIEFLAIYLLCAAGGSVLTILVDPDQSAVGASGAIFGVVGLLFVVSRRHHAVLGGQARTMVARDRQLPRLPARLHLHRPEHQLDRPPRRPDRRSHPGLLPAANRRRDDGGHVARAVRRAAEGWHAGMDARGGVRRRRDAARRGLVCRGRPIPRLTDRAAHA